MATDVIRSVGQVIAEAKNLGLRDLSPEALSEMLKETRAVRGRVAAEIAREGERFQQARQAGRWSEMEEAREQIIALQDDLQDVEEHAARVSDAYQEAHLVAGVRERLGGARRATILEVFILTLIGAVLLILWVESAYQLTEAEQQMLVIADTVICVIFLTEFFWRMQFADSKVWYWRRYWIDFLASLPLAGVLRIGRVARLARAARIARIARAARVLRALRALAFLSRGFDKIAAIFKLQVFSRPLMLTVGLLIVGGILISRMEGAQFEDVRGLAKGMWWSFTTVVTGGFADIHNPASAMGQVLTVVLVILGIILTGALTAGLANILLGDDTARIQRNQMVIQQRIDELTARLAGIEKILRDSKAGNEE